MKIYNIFYLGLILFLFFCENNGNASRIRITNKSESPIEMEILPEPISEEPPYCWKCLDSCLKSKGINSTEIVVSIKALKGGEKFAITGTQGGFLFKGTCRNLSVSKNYEIIFLENKLGINCVSREI